MKVFFHTATNYLSRLIENYGSKANLSDLSLSFQEKPRCPVLHKVRHASFVTGAIMQYLPKMPLTLHIELLHVFVAVLIAHNRCKFILFLNW